jgi:4-hydroxybenzoate polyprenyltransferase
VNSLKGLDLNYLALVLSMFLFNGFIFTYNDLEDAPYDKEDTYKKIRNVFCGDDRRKKVIGKVIIFTTPLLSVLLGLYVSVGWALFALGLLALGFLYSSPVFRAKERPVWDLVFHILWISMMVVPGYLYFFTPDRLFFLIWGILATNSSIAQINNELRDFSVDSLAGHRTTVIVLGKKRTFFLRWALELLLVSLILWMAVAYELHVLLLAVIPSFLYFVWVERIQALDNTERIGDHRRMRIAYFLFLWMCVGIAEAALKRFF